jgi:transcriptional regulator with XRE-family HTH domain
MEKGKFRSLKAWRKANLLSQVDAAKRLGVTQAHWCRLENHERLPSRLLAKRLARATGLTMRQLLLAPRRRRPSQTPPVAPMEAQP